MTETIYLNPEEKNVQITIKPNTQTNVIEVNTSNGTKQNITITLKENSIVNYQILQNSSENAENQTQRKAIVHENARINWTEISLGGKNTVSNTTTLLQGEGAETKNYGVILGSKKQKFDINVQAIHEKPRTTSNMITKTVLNDQSHAEYEGLIKINANAVQCNGHQKEDALLLSDNAKINAVPILEISNDDVKCSHGITISQIDEEKLFYMTSRGLTEATAKKTIVKGFFKPILKDVEDKELRKQIETAINERLGAIA